MARIKLSEVRAKTLIYKALNVQYQGISFDLLNDDDERISQFFNEHGSAVVKVDQAVKKRNKLGLVEVNVKKASVDVVLKKYKDMGYRWVIIEPVIEHSDAEEKYLSFELTDAGTSVLYSPRGGVGVEESPQLIKNYLIKNNEFPSELTAEGFTANNFKKVINMFDEAHCTNLEINPLLLRDGAWSVLDAAMQVDSSADFFADDWNLTDERFSLIKQHPLESEVETFASKSPASLSLKVLNEEGNIFLLLSGGGASVVILDEFAAKGVVERVSNYGEYSGNPNREETYRYASAVLKLMQASKASSKVLFIAGGVANFTDIAKTFDGIIDAFEEFEELLNDPQVLVVVRRAGPNDDIGLRRIKNYMNDKNIRHIVDGAEVTIAQAVNSVVDHAGDSNA